MDINENSLKLLQKKNIEISKYVGTHFSENSVLEYFFEGQTTTASGFSFFYFSNYLSHSRNKYLETIIHKYFNKFITSSISDHQSKEVEHSKFGKYPNNYNSSIQLAGILKTISLNFINTNTDHNTIIMIEGFKDHIKNLESVINKNNGFIARILEEDGGEIPSPYLTYWALECLTLYDAENIEKKIYLLIWDWALSSLYKSLAYSHSNIRYGIDTIETCYLVLILNRISNLKPNNIKNIFEAKNIIRHTLDILFSNHFKSGCFTKSLPVFGTDKGYSLVCPTVEPLSLLILSNEDFLGEYLEYLLDTFDYIKSVESPFYFNEFSNQKNIWRSEWTHSNSYPNLFMTASVATFLNVLEVSLGNVLSNNSKSISFEKSFISELFFNETNENYFNRKCNEKIEEYAKLIREGEHKPHIISCISKNMRESFIGEIAHKCKKKIIVFDFEVITTKGWENFNHNTKDAFENIVHIKDVIILIDNIDILENTNVSEDFHRSSQNSAIYYYVKEVCTKSKSFIFLGVSTSDKSTPKKWKDLFRNNIIREVYEIQPLNKCQRFESRMESAYNLFNIGEVSLKKRIIDSLNKNHKEKLGELFYPDIIKLITTINSKVSSIRTGKDEELIALFEPILNDICYNNKKE